MATLLTNRRMDPALRARIEESVSARKSGVAYRALVRFGITLTVGAALVSFYVQRRGGERALEQQRSALLAEIHEHAAAFGPRERSAIGHIEKALERLVGSYEGDVEAHDLVRTRPTVYVHGALDGFSTPVSIQRSSAASSNDAFAACWVDPPRSRTESRVVARVKTAYAGGVAMPNVHRLGDAYAALRLLEPSWEARVRKAHDEHDMLVLQNELHRTPFEDGKQALDAEVLLAVVDEPGDPASPAELDGERPHDVRVLLFDLASEQVLLRTRKRVSPDDWASAARAELASGLDACALAFDLTQP